MKPTEAQCAEVVAAIRHDLDIACRTHGSERVRALECAMQQIRYLIREAREDAPPKRGGGG
jgi:hypothetical protein